MRFVNVPLNQLDDDGKSEFLLMKIAFFNEHKTC